MALKLKTLDLNYGIRLTDVYFRIRIVSYDCINGTINYNGEFYINEKMRELGHTYAISGMYLAGSIKSDMKDKNLFELSYNHIKEKAEELRGKTIEEIEQYNDTVFAQNKDAEGNIINPLYFYFIDAEDC